MGQASAHLVYRAALTASSRGLPKTEAFGHHRRMNRSLAAIAAIWLTTCFLVAFVDLGEVHAQPRFGLEAAVGQGGGATPYIDNAAYLDFDTPTLADEIPGTGASFSFHLVFDELEANLGLQLFDREQVEITHVSDESLPENRVRPDGTIDDAGIEYRKLADSRRLTVPDRSRGALVLGTLGAAYRWYFFSSERFDFYAPFGGGLGFIHIDEEARPWVFGLFGFSGVAASFDVAPPVGIFVSARVNGLVTPSYLDFDDASRAAVIVGDSTEAAAFDTMIYGSVQFGLQFTVR